MSSPATSVIHMASAAAAAMLLLAGLAFQLGNRDAVEPAVQPADITAELAPGADLAPVLPDAALPFLSGAMPVSAGSRPMLAVIIDDIGPDRSVADAFIGAGLPLTLSILPFAQAAPEIARAASREGLEVFLHLPMEPVGLADPGPNALIRAHDAAEISRRLRWALSRVPGASGFNNHMGSAMTADAAAMERVFESLRGSQLIFVDSLTHPRSVAAGAAARAGLPALRRDIFLDHVRTREAVDAAIDQALDRALASGSAIAIGHPHAMTLAALETLAERAELAGVELVTVSQLAAARAQRRSSQTAS
ncbi:divergent polysaccharide deacetylase family protein [Glycocaulis sp.]|uniref:divergent polysaccharide deacetylase family protein n=1 Tax=Glycocaulis sp. TaxID=1969725 RepID=UPI003D1BD09F